MRAITIRQPYASFIADGLKRYETRDWPVNFRGNIAIHASEKWNQHRAASLNQLTLDFPELEKYSYTKPPLGVVVAACRVVACHRVEDIRDQLSALELAVGDYSDGRFAWQLELVKLPDEPIPATGKQGIWEWTPTREDLSGV